MINSSKTLIIAEAGVNHNGCLETAKKLIDAAFLAGVDYVKFQTFEAGALVTKSASKAEYQVTNTNSDNSQYKMLKKLELSHNAHQELIDYCAKKGIKFFSTAFDVKSLSYLKILGLTLAKVPSGELTNLPYLVFMAKNFQQVILSTGMATMNEVKMAFQVLLDSGMEKENITILHCNTEYPTPMQDVNLLAMLDIKNTLGVEVGYSDHTLGIEIPIAAVALGATVIEKHFTLDRNSAGPDHSASLEPDELKAMVLAIRNIELAIAGSGKKEPSPSEIKNTTSARKSIVAARDIGVGELFSEDNLCCKRPGSGISPMLWEEIIGRQAHKQFKMDDLIEIES